MTNTAKGAFGGNGRVTLIQFIEPIASSKAHVVIGELPVIQEVHPDVLEGVGLATYSYANTEHAQQTRRQSMGKVQSLLQHPPLAMFDPP